MGQKVLIVGGSREFTGAVYLAGMAALRSGAESVIIMAPTKVAWALNALSPDLITRKLDGAYLAPKHLKAIQRQLATADVLVLGNGATTHRGVVALMCSLMGWPGLKVVDADALKALRDNAVCNAVLTPNEGEWILLQHHNDIKTLLSKNNVIIRKGNPSQLLSATKTFRQPRTNRGLTKAGTGDVLAGLCAGYLAQGLPPWKAAKKAMQTGNAIADILTKKKRGYFFLASDMAEELRKSKNLRRHTDAPTRS